MYIGKKINKYLKNVQCISKNVPYMYEKFTTCIEKVVVYLKKKNKKDKKENR